MADQYGRYAEIFDGLRSFYEKRTGEKSAPAYWAAAVLSLISFLGIGSCVMLVAILVGESASPIHWIFQWRLGIAVAAALTIVTHVIFAKKVKVYARVGEPLSKDWSRTFVLMLGTVVVLLVLVVLFAYSKAHE